jgi:hypothetical protein
MTKAAQEKSNRSRYDPVNELSLTVLGELKDRMARGRNDGEHEAGRFR